jgi:glycine/sarcosine N-methyltransferase
MRTEKTKAVQTFYDRLAGDYDGMTGLEKRFGAERAVFQRLVEMYGIRSAVDAGAGTGFHSILLAGLGVRVCAVDLSSAMLVGLRENARRHGVEVETIESSFKNLPRHLKGKYGAVFCLGNSLAHVLTKAEMAATLAAFHRVLEPGGIVVLQLLNYEKIIEKRERIQGAKEEGEKIFLRFYDFVGEKVRFNILTIIRTAAGFMTRIESVWLRPWLAADLQPVLAKAGFSSTEIFGAVSMEPFDAQASKDLVIISKTRSMHLPR